MVAPGVPDIYQGSELLNFSLVDPDNRRLPDFDELEKLLMNNEKTPRDDENAWMSGQLKQHIVAVLARYRQQKPALFLQGDYVALTAAGVHDKNVIAFARTFNDDAAIIAAPRLVFDTQKVHFNQTEDGWDMQILLPASLANRTYSDLLSGRERRATDRIDLSTWPRDEPVVLCSSPR
jgi:(1->4)-alpha-D-glucan 1-alpha-D-glucosylmutase